MAYFTKTLVYLLLVLPIGCLAWKWPALPARVPLHLSSAGNSYGDKYVLLPLVLLPLALYLVLPVLYRAKAAEPAYRPLATGLTIFLSLALATLVVTSA